MAGQVGNNAYSPFNCIYNTAYSPFNCIYNTFMNGLELNQTVWIQHCLIFYLIMNTELHGVPRNMIVGKWFWMSSIYKFGLSVCLSVCLYPINVKTAEPIGPKFFVGHHMTTGKVYEWSKFQIFVKIRELFLFCFTMYTKRTCSQFI